MVERETDNAFYDFLETKGAYKEYMQTEFNKLREQFELEENKQTLLSSVYCYEFYNRKYLR